jgi:hypothetical protein
MFCKLEISVLKRKAVYEFLFFCIIQNMFSLKISIKYVTQLNACILSFVDCSHVATNLKHSGMHNLKIVDI